MAKPNEVAAELRKLADSLDSMNHNTDIPYAFVHLTHTQREPFLEMVRLMPRPLKKDVSSPGERYAEVRMRYQTPGINLWVCAPQSLTCTLIEPAKPAVYRCDPILSPEEDAALETE